MTDLVNEELETNLGYSDNIHGINRGGCAINAVAIYDFISFNFPEYKPEITYLGFDIDYGDKSMSDEIDDFIKYGSPMFNMLHAIVIITVGENDLYLDSTGMYSYPQYDGNEKENTGTISRDDCIDHINRECWNTTFDPYEGTREIDDVWDTCLAEELEICN